MLLPRRWAFEIVILDGCVFFKHVFLPRRRAFEIVILDGCFCSNVCFCPGAGLLKLLFWVTIVAQVGVLAEARGL